MITCAEFAQKLRWASVRTRNELEIPTEEFMVIVEKAAKDVIGTYAYGWPALKPETIARKAQGDTPLLETGEMRDSIRSIAALSVLGAEGLVYSTDPVAVYQELGTSRGIPPRSFLYKSIVHSLPVMPAIFARFAEQIIAR